MSSWLDSGSRTFEPCRFHDTVPWARSTANITGGENPVPPGLGTMPYSTTVEVVGSLERGRRVRHAGGRDTGIDRRGTPTGAGIQHGDEKGLVGPFVELPV